MLSGPDASAGCPPTVRETDPRAADIDASAADPASTGQRNKAVATTSTISAHPAAAVDEAKFARRARHSSNAPVAARVSGTHAANTFV